MKSVAIFGTNFEAFLFRFGLILSLKMILLKLLSSLHFWPPAGNYFHSTHTFEITFLCFFKKKKRYVKKIANHVKNF